MWQQQQQHRKNDELQRAGMYMYLGKRRQVTAVIQMGGYSVSGR